MKKRKLLTMFLSLFVLSSCNSPKGGKGGTNKDLSKEVYEDYINPKKLLLERNLAFSITSDYTSSIRTGQSIRTCNVDRSKVELAFEQTGEEDYHHPNYASFNYDETNDLLSFDWYTALYYDKEFIRYNINHQDITHPDFNYYATEYLGLIIDVSYDELTYENGAYVAHHINRNMSGININIDTYEISFSGSFISKIKLNGSMNEQGVSYTYTQEIVFSKFNSVSVIIPTI